MSVLPAVFVLTVFSVYLLWWLHHRQHHPLPPGPPGLPVVGNVLQLMRDQIPWLAFAKLSKRYGDVIHVSVFGQPLIILNSSAAVNDLLEKRSGIYSDRPQSVMACELCGYDGFFSVAPYGERHKKARQLLNRHIGQNTVTRWRGVVEHLARRFILSLLQSPEDWYDHLRLMAASVAIRIPVGVDVPDLKHPLVQLGEQMVCEVMQAYKPGAWMVDVLPFLKLMPEWLPGASFKKTARQFREHAMQLRDQPFQIVKDDIAAGTASPSLLSAVITEDTEANPQMEDIYKYVAGTAYGAAVDTTKATLKWGFLAMVLYPEVQRKAQQELDLAIEPERLPAFGDRPKLPYIEALLKELYRWQPVAPLAVPHRVMEDDIYRGYRIPAGSTVLGNIWAVTHDPMIYPEPFDFKPERFIHNAKESLNPDPRAWVFGFGRRACPGRYLAEDTIFITIAMVLASFTIEKALDDAGNPITPTTESENASGISAPKTFACRITPRSPELASLLGET